MKNINIILVLSFITVACAISNVSTFASYSEESVLKIERLNGLTEEKVIEEFGKPFLQDQYKMEDAVGEFRVELYNTYPLSNPDNLKVEIKELWWEDGDYFITVWLHLIEGKWIVLDTYRWHKTVEF